MNKTVKKLKTSLIDEILNNHTTLLRLFEKPQTKSTIIKSKEGKTLIQDEEIADRWEQNVGELYNDTEELEELDREVEITPEKLGPPITKSEFEKALN